MSRIKAKNTGPERRFRSLLHRAGFRFRLHVEGLPGKPDIVLPKYRAVIFVNGCFWHRHEGCPFAYTPTSRPEFWLPKFQKTIERDLQKSRELECAGWNVIVVWECEIKSSPGQTLTRVIDEMTDHHE